jgi:hypothetical protein
MAPLASYHEMTSTSTDRDNNHNNGNHDNDNMMNTTMMTATGRVALMRARHEEGVGMGVPGALAA